MKTSRLLLFPILAGGLILGARADDKKDSPDTTPAPSEHRHLRSLTDDEPMEKEPVTFLGVETSPAGAALSTQLGLPPDTGLVVNHVVPDSAAAGALKKHDILTKFDDQILVDTRQLSVLVRSHKEGDEVLLTFIRGGKEQSQKVKLGKHEHARVLGFNGPDADPDQIVRFYADGEMPELQDLQKVPGLTREDFGKMLQMLKREHGQWFGSPGVHIISREKGKGSTVLNLADGNFVFSDDVGSVEINAAKGKRELTVKDKKGAVTFKGPITDEADRKKLPAEVVARLDKIDKLDVGGEPGEDFEVDAAAINPPEKTKISLPPALREIGQPAAPF